MRALSGRGRFCVGNRALFVERLTAWQRMLCRHAPFFTQGARRVPFSRGQWRKACVGGSSGADLRSPSTGACTCTGGRFHGGRYRSAAGKSKHTMSRAKPPANTAITGCNVMRLMFHVKPMSGCRFTDLRAERLAS
jgi:hypothetical protein